MKNYRVLLSLSLLFIGNGIFFTAAGSAADISHCSTVVQRCYTQSADARPSCFYHAAKDVSCKGTPLAKLCIKRWAMTPSRITGIESAPALLGPQLVDQSCIEKFDMELSSSLVSEQLTPELIKQLEDKLGGCKKVPSSELLRP